MRRAQIAGLLLWGALLSLTAPAQSNSQQILHDRSERLRQTVIQEQPLSKILPIKTMLRRIVLLIPPESADPHVRQLLAAVRAERDGVHKRTSLFNIKPPAAAPPNAPAKTPLPSGKSEPGAKSKGDRSAGKVAAKQSADSIENRKTKNENLNADSEEEPPVTTEQLQALTSTLFYEALAQRLQARLNIQVIPAVQTEAALKALHLSLETASRPEGAMQLQNHLDCDAVILPKVLRVAARKGPEREVAVWAELQIAAQQPSDSLSVFEGKNRQVKGADEETLLLPRVFPAAGASSCGQMPFQARYLQSLPHLALQAGQQAAAMAVHTLWTGEIGPLARSGERIALTPVAAPTQADSLRFTSEGRKVMPAALRGLPADVSARFAPDLLPLFAPSVRGPEETRRAMQALKLTPALLWAKEDRPDTAHVIALGKRLGVEYVLLAQITDIQISEGQSAAPPLPAGGQKLQNTHLETKPGEEYLRPGEAGEENRREARAEAVGTLVRVSDGALLWQERTTATMSLKSRGEGSAAEQAADHQVATDATRFALLQLQRRFRQYRSRFEQ